MGSKDTASNHREVRRRCVAHCSGGGGVSAGDVEIACETKRLTVCGWQLLILSPICNMTMQGRPAACGAVMTDPQQRGNKMT
jgi:hypothetical protein